LVTTGRSAIAAVEALDAAEVDCRKCFSIFDYQFPSAVAAFEARGITHKSLTNLTVLLNSLEALHRFEPRELEAVWIWHRQQGDHAAR
jgi:orotate phosphoribosyltransferase